MSTLLKYKRDIDLKMSLTIHKQNSVEFTSLPINKDTSYDIYYDVWDSGTKKYLYIKLIENTANSPFFYNRSYELEDLYNNHRIFKTCETLEEIKKRLKSLFEKNKISLRFDQDEEIVVMEMDVMLFATPYKLEFQLYREMIIEEEKDQKLIELYELNKEKLKKLKEIFSSIKKENGNLKNDLFNIYKRFEIPGIEALSFS